MKVTKDRHMGLDVYRVEQAPIATRALRDHADWIDDRWYYREAIRNWERLDGDGMTIAKGREIVGVYAYVPMLDGSDYEEIVIEDGVPDTAERMAGTLFARIAQARWAASVIAAEQWRQANPIPRRR